MPAQVGLVGLVDCLFVAAPAMSMVTHAFALRTLLDFRGFMSARLGALFIAWGARLLAGIAGLLVIVIVASHAATSGHTALAGADIVQVAAVHAAHAARLLAAMATQTLVAPLVHRVPLAGRGVLVPRALVILFLVVLLTYRCLSR